MTDELSKLVEKTNIKKDAKDQVELAEYTHYMHEAYDEA